MLDKAKQAMSNDKVNEQVDKAQDEHIKNDKVNEGIDKVRDHVNDQDNK